MRQIIEQFHESASTSGVKIVHSCGWDCAPADLGVLFLAQHSETVLHRSSFNTVRLICRLFLQMLSGFNRAV